MQKSIATIEKPATPVEVKQLPAVLSIDKVENAIDVFLSFQDIKHKTPTTYKRALRQYFGWVRSTERVLAALTRADVLQFKRDMEGLGYSPNTINLYLTAVRRFYEFCDVYEIAPNIAKGIKSERTSNDTEHVKRGFSDEQAGAILTAVRMERVQRKERPAAVKIRKTENEYNAPDNIRRRDVAIMELMMRCGLRTIEIVRANIGDITMEGEFHVMRVWGKGDKIRRVVLTPKTWNAVNEYLLHDRRGAKDNEPLFASAAHQCVGARMCTETISRMAKRNIRAIGINDSKHTAHSCRHTAITNMLTAAQKLSDKAATAPAGERERLLAMVEEIKTQNRVETTMEASGHAEHSTMMIYVKDEISEQAYKHAPNLVSDEIIK